MLGQQEKNVMIPSIPVLTLSNCICTHLLLRPNRDAVEERDSCNVDKQLGRLCGAAKTLSCLTSSVTCLVHPDAELLNDCYPSKQQFAHLQKWSMKQPGLLLTCTYMLSVSGTHDSSRCCGSSFPYPNVSDAYNPQRSKTEQQQRTMVTDHAAWRNLSRQIVLAVQSHVQFRGEIKYFMKLFCIFPHHPSTVLSLVTSLNGFHGCLWVMGLISWVNCFKGKLTAAFHRRSSFIQQKALRDSLPNFLLAAQVILLPSAFSIGSLPTYIIWTITSWNWEFSVTETNVGGFFLWR